MKLQQLAVVFIIIVLPIALVLSEYLNNNMEVLASQADYDKVLYSATYDAVRAFQMNTLNNGYSTIQDSKLRDISASVNSFYNSLASGLGSSGYRQEDLQSYIPAILFTMYDGYYLYGDYQNIVSIQGGQPVYSEDNSRNLNSTAGIKPFIYYTCEYKDSGQFDIVVNYTLDNYITVMGTNASGTRVNRSGYLIRTDGLTVKSDGTVDVHGITVGHEKLGEYLIILDQVTETNDSGMDVDVMKLYNTDDDGNGDPDPRYYPYVFYNNEKYYYDPYIANEIANNQITQRPKSYSDIPIFTLDNNLRNYMTNENSANVLAEYILGDGATYNQLNQDNFLDKSAYNYYRNAIDFSVYVNNLFDNAGPLSIVTESYNNQLNYTTTNDSGEEIPIHSRASYDIKDVFDLDSPDNDPEAEDSLFNEHRMDVIISSIESNLMTIIANFNLHQNSGYEFVLPVMTEEDWYNIANNITVVSFMQGLPIGNYKYYNNYSVVMNTRNKEFVSRDSIIIRIEEDGNRSNDTAGTYHNPRCLTLNQEADADTANSNTYIGYSNVDYEQISVRYDVNTTDPTSGSSTETLAYYYYPHSGSGAYECIIGKNDVKFTPDNLLTGSSYIDESNGNTEYTPNDKIRAAYITALAREKNNLYKISDYFNNY